MSSLFIDNIKELVTLQGVSKKRGRRPKQKDLTIINNAALFIDKGRIQWIGRTQQKRSFLKKVRGPYKKLDAKQAIIFPGLVDPHTHLIFGGSRHKEFSWRCEGQSYLDIAKKGGGILSTVKATQKATLTELVQLGLKRINQHRAFGTTTIEIKSGYGLSVKDELKSLKAIQLLQKKSPVRLIPTFLGAHAFPTAYKNKKGAYVALICKKMIPTIRQQRLAQFCDVFIEEGFFSLSETKKIIAAAKKHGLNIRLHSDEFKPLGGTELAVQEHATSTDHLIAITPKGIAALAKSKTVATLLPGTSFFLGKKFAPARALIDAGVRVAIGTDFNPGTCMTQSLPLIGSIAAARMQMTVAEVITAITYNAACSVGLEKEIGSIEVGKKADLALFDIPSHEYLFYHFGDNLCRQTIVSGKLA